MDTVTVTSEDRKGFLEAYKLFAGDVDAYINTKDKQWGKIIWFLKQSGYSPYEFFHFVIHYLGEENYARIRYKAFICSTNVWGQFKTFKKNRPKQIQGLIQSQRALLLPDLEVSKDKINLLLKPGYPISSPVILDIALLIASEEKLDITPVLNKFLTDTVFIIYCSPEFLEHCIQLKLYMSKEQLW